MMYGQYCRIESRAGGVFATNREFIRAALSMIKKRHRYSRDLRDQRHTWLREGIVMLRDAKVDYHAVMFGSTRP